MTREEAIEKVLDAKTGGTTHDLAKALLEVEAVPFQESDRQDGAHFAPIPFEPGDFESIAIVIEAP